MNLLLIFVLALVFTALLLPAYRRYTLSQHSRLAAAQLLDLSKRGRVWQLNHPQQRLSSLEALGYDAMSIYVSSDGGVSQSTNINSIYRISLGNPGASAMENCGLGGDDLRNGFVLVAEPIQTQLIDTSCAKLCLVSSGQRGVSGSAAADRCWSQN